MSNKDIIDIIPIVKSLWLKRYLIVLSTFLFGLFGIIYSFVTPPVYTSYSTFVPQIERAPGMSGSLGGLASLAGIKLGKVSMGDDIPPMIYPKILASTPFQLEILDCQLVLEDGSKVSYRDYLYEESNSLFSSLRRFLMSDGEDHREPLPDAVLDSLPLRISKDDFKLIKGLKDVISLAINENEGYLTIAVHDENALVAAQVAKTAEKTLQRMIVDFKIEKSKELYRYTTQQWEEKKSEVYSMQDSLALFNDRNLNISTAYVQNKRMRLEAEYNVLLGIYTDLANQREEIALQLEKDTPVFTVIDPVKVPNKKSNASRLVLAFLGAFMGFVLSMVYVLIRGPFIDLKKQLNS